MNDAKTAVDSAVLIALFREVNEHMRATESKHLQLAIGYMSLLGLALSILATFGTKGKGAATSGFIQVTWAQLIAYGALSAVGCLSLFILDAFRGWKQHYRIVARWLVVEMGAGDLPVAPRWLAHHPYQPMTFRKKPMSIRSRPLWGVPSPDNALTYFIGLATALAVAIFDYGLWTLISLRPLRVGLVVVAAVSFLGFVFYSRIRVSRRVKRDKAEIDEHGLYPDALL